MNIKRVLLVTSLLFVLVGCGVNEAENEEVVVDEVEEIEEVEVHPEPDENEDSTEEVDEEGVTGTIHEHDEERMNRIALAEAIMIESFEGSGEVSYDPELDILGVAPTDEGFARDIYYIMIGVSDKEAWNSLVDNVSEFSIVISELVDEEIQVAILNPESTDRVLLLVQNGFVIYDFADEI